MSETIRDAVCIVARAYGVIALSALKALIEGVIRL
jgi:hypothetical protein